MPENETQTSPEETVSETAPKTTETATPNPEGVTDTSAQSAEKAADDQAAKPTETATPNPEGVTDTSAQSAEKAADDQAAKPTETAQVAEKEAKPESKEARADVAATAETKEEQPVPPEEISYHAVEKEGEITAIWEMQGQKHLRTIDPRSTEGKKIFSLFTSEIHETDSPPLASEATS